MRRREFITFRRCGGGLAARGTARSRPAKCIAYSGLPPNPSPTHSWKAFARECASAVTSREGTSSLSFATPRQSRCTARGDIRIDACATADLAVSSGPAIRAMKAATDIPVLFAISGDPVELGLVKSLARPGGNFTGSTFLSLDLAGKRVELLKEIFPQLRTARRAVEYRSSGRTIGVERYAAGSAIARHQSSLCSFRRGA